MRLRDLIERHAGGIFGGRVRAVSDSIPPIGVIVWLGDGEPWQIDVEPELDAVRGLLDVGDLVPVRREDRVRLWLRDLIERHAVDVFGSGVKKVWDTGARQVLQIWLDDGSEWRISVEPPKLATIF